jgi:hypothetical protein
MGLLDLMVKIFFLSYFEWTNISMLIIVNDRHGFNILFVYFVFI